MNTVVVTFPGSNCDHDCIYVLRDILDCNVREVFHKETALGDCDTVIVPGGFSYGDYLRAGALAKYSPIMADIQRFADRGGTLVGICNGFQILCEVGLLPGALVPNRGIRFISREVELSVVNNDTIFSSAYRKKQKIRMPIAHAEGCYFADKNTLQFLEENNRIIFRYADPPRSDCPDGNPNGSANAIAGIINNDGNVLGMMPHPERAADEQIGSIDGLGVFQSMLAAFSEGDLIETLHS